MNDHTQLLGDDGSFTPIIFLPQIAYIELQQEYNNHAGGRV
jgi:hypothetical protein